MMRFLISLLCLGLLVTQSHAINFTSSFDVPNQLDFRAARLGDIDGDGKEDFALGLPHNYDSGQVQVFSGATRTILRTVVPPIPEHYDEFGASVSSVPDITGDGIPDLVVGAPGFGYAGMVHVFNGATGAWLYAFSSPAPDYNGAFGMTTMGIPDINGDGHGDIMVGTVYEEADSEPDMTGRAYLFSGLDGSLLNTFVPPIPRFNMNFGTAVTSVPDLSGDGIPDLVISAPGEYRGTDPIRCGYVYVYNGANYALLRTLTAPVLQTKAYFGTSLIGIPDVTGDGLGDILVASPGEQACYLFNGAAGIAVQRIAPPGVGADTGLGIKFALTPNISGSGPDNLLIPAPAAKKAFIYSLTTTPTLQATLTVPGSSDYNGGLIGGDFDGDGAGDMILPESTSYYYDLNASQLEISSGALSIISNTTFSLGNTPINATPLTQTFVVTNHGIAPLHIANFQITPPFTVLEPLNSLIDSDTSDSFTIQMPTTSAGILQGALGLNSDDPQHTTFSLALYGAVEQPSLQFLNETTPVSTESTVTLGSLPIGNANTKSFTIFNAGFAPLLISALTPGPGVTIISPLSGTISAQTTATFTISLSSAVISSFVRSLSILSNDPLHPVFNVYFQGTFDGPEISYSFNGTPLSDGATIDFGSIIAASGQPYRDLLISNTGTAQLRITAVSIPNQYTANTAPCTVGYDNQTGYQHIIRFTMQDATIGDCSGTAQIISDDPDETTFTLHLVGQVISRPVTYVRSDAPAGGDGTSWATAKRTITAATALGAYRDIWGAAGTYRETVRPTSNMNIYGGFAGTERTLSQRDVFRNVTIIDANKGKHAVYAYTVSNSILDGFSVTGGWAYHDSGGGTNFADLYGAGILVDSSTLTIRNCYIYGNQAAEGGGGVCGSSGTARLENCVIGGNSSDDTGGGVDTQWGSAVLTNCRIEGNLAHFGGGISGHSGNSTGVIWAQNCIIAGNATTVYGGGLQIDNISSATITNCTISNNTASSNGGGVQVKNDIGFFNCIFSGNSPRGINEYNSYSNAFLRNCLFNQNTNGDVFDYSLNATLTGAANINAQMNGASGNVDGSPAFEPSRTGTWTQAPAYSNPVSTLTDANAHFGAGLLRGQFLRTSPVAGVTNVEFYIIDNTETQITVYGNMNTFMVIAGTPYEIVDYHLTNTSAAINVGTASVSTLPATDFAGNPRTAGSAPDDGAFEFSKTSGPSIVSIRRMDPLPLAGSSARFMVEFDRSVTGVDTADFILHRVWAPSASITSASGSGRFFIVTMQFSGTPSGSIRLDVNDNDSIRDALTIPLGGTGLANGNYEQGESYELSPVPNAAQTWQMYQ